ncbi:MAG: hypothetical protein K2K57_02720 [Oscillospiraceae bacterium]|nr:hypothetical protein [Oscillospiraceae bacterium]
MKKIIEAIFEAIFAMVLVLLCALTFTSCKKEDNPVVQASEYVSSERSELEDIGQEKEDQLADLDSALKEEIG